MFKLLGRIFGTEKGMEAAVSGLTNGLGALFYTDQEKAEDGAQDRAAARTMFIAWMDKTQGQNLARRVLAFMIAGTWLLQYFMVMGFSLSAVWAESPDKLTASADTIGQFADGMTGAMMLILGFYFAAPHLGKIADGALARFGRTQRIENVTD